eukprot:scaffold247749_cov48-Prasinocladus_malaysianus.AAC.1
MDSIQLPAVISLFQRFIGGMHHAMAVLISVLCDTSALCKIINIYNCTLASDYPLSTAAYCQRNGSNDEASLVSIRSYTRRHNLSKPYESLAQARQCLSTITCTPRLNQKARSQARYAQRTPSADCCGSVVLLRQPRRRIRSPAALTG